jgi:hypothetical protein
MVKEALINAVLRYHLNHSSRQEGTGGRRAHRGLEGKGFACVKP